jgi:hypothetical protein
VFESSYAVCRRITGGTRPHPTDCPSLSAEEERCLRRHL